VKKIILTVGLHLIALGSFAQKFNIQNAILAQKDRDILVAKEYIDKAVIDDKTSKDPKAWFYKGSIYEDILNGNPEDKVAAPDALKIAAEAYQKSISLDKPEGDWKKSSEKNLLNLWGSAINDGADKYNKKQYQGALESFNLAKSIKPEDTTAYLYSSVSAELVKEWASAKADYYKLISIGKNSADIYKYLIRITRDIDKDNTKTYEVVSEARKLYPRDKDLINIQLDLAMKMGKTDEVLKQLEDAAIADPANAKTYYYNLGTIYSDPKNKNKEKALEYYQKSIDADTNYYDAQFNTAILYWEDARVEYQKVNDMDYGTYQKIGKQTEEKGNVFAKKALPYFESAYRIKNDDPKLKQVLRDCYRNLKMDAKLKALGI